MDKPPSKVALATTWCALALTFVLLVYGVVRYGLHPELHPQFWSDIAGRLHGPMTFRFILQPTMALIAALHDGIADARQGHKAFFWTALRDPTQHRGRLREGLRATSRLMLLGFAMDAIYQFKVFDTFRPIESVVMVLLLAVLPYFVLRWGVEYVARRWLARKGSPRA